MIYTTNFREITVHKHILAQKKQAQKKAWLFRFLLLAFVALAFGITFGDSSSNHPTYLPPGMQLADPSYLEYDWWLTHATHYHVAFNFLIFILAKIDLLVWGTAGLNLLVVTLSLFVIFNHFYKQNSEYALVAMGIFCSIYLLTGSFNSVASTYLFTSGLQASNISTFATIAAIIGFLGKRYLICGLCLGCAGLFHVNFLLVNLLSFSLAFAFAEIKQIYTHRYIYKQQFSDLVSLAAPSVTLLLFYLPLIFDVTQSSNSKGTSDLADYVFFQFAVPHHYLPTSYLFNFLAFAGWHVMGMSFLILSPQSKKLHALHNAMFTTVWLATALTTLVFIEPVARLFFWRLAPFCLILVCFSIYAGFTSLTVAKPTTSKRKLLIASAGTIAGALLILRVQLYYYSFGSPRVLLMAFILAAIVTGPVLTLVSLQYTSSIQIQKRRTSKFITLIMLVIAAGSFYATFNSEKYSLIFLSEAEKNKRALYYFVKQNTPQTAQILVPPSLDTFRLFTERSIVVDFKALPFQEHDLVEWYHRLSRVSGVAKPRTFDEVSTGYKAMDEARLAELKRTYHISYVVLNAEHRNFIEWRPLYKNTDFVLLQYIGSKE